MLALSDEADYISSIKRIKHWFGVSQIIKCFSSIASVLARKLTRGRMPHLFIGLLLTLPELRSNLLQQH